MPQRHAVTLSQFILDQERKHPEASGELLQPIADPIRDERQALLDPGLVALE